jgi:iron uptake system component EfeO
VTVRFGVVVAGLSLPLALVGCQAADRSAAEDAFVTVAAADDACAVSPATWPAGARTLLIDNRGEQVTEVYVLRPDGSVVAERENITPGQQVELVVELSEGDYRVTCKPGMVGEGFSTAVTATPATGGSGSDADPRLTAAAEAYRTWVAHQVDHSAPPLRRLVAAVVAGDLAAAREHYAPSRVGWERIEPVAEAFGDLDPAMDLRVHDVEPGDRWTGWHRLEKAIWADQDLTAMGPVARQLARDYRTLGRRISDAEITASSMGNGAKELLDEVATGKVTGEEERYSHTDLVDFEANVVGARQAYELLRPVVVDSDPTLAEQLDAAFAACLAELHRYGRGTDYVGYDALTAAQVERLVARVDALGEPLSRLTSTVVS